jgi:hypothetical protein
MNVIYVGLLIDVIFKIFSRKRTQFINMSYYFFFQESFCVPVVLLLPYLKLCWRVWIGLIRLRIGTVDYMLWTWEWALWFLKRRGISWQAERKVNFSKKTRLHGHLNWWQLYLALFKSFLHDKSFLNRTIKLFLYSWRVNFHREQIKFRAHSKTKFNQKLSINL